MKPPGLAVIAFSVVCAAGLRAADATTPIDFTQRNSPYAPGENPAATPQKKSPAVNEPLQEKRVEKSTIDRRTAPLSGRRSAVEVQEAREKNVVEKDSHRPEKLEEPTSAFNHRSAAITTGGDTTKPPTVAKYQDGLTAASATNMARFPAMDRATGAKINRFVFRKNPTETPVTTSGAAVTPAAGGSPLQK